MSKSKKSEKKPVADGPIEKPMVRAIRVTPELLAAAKAYRKETGMSFYALGMEAVSARLEKEGYLKGSASARA